MRFIPHILHARSGRFTEAVPNAVRDHRGPDRRDRLSSLSVAVRPVPAFSTPRMRSAMSVTASLVVAAGEAAGITLAMVLYPYRMIECDAFLATTICRGHGRFAASIAIAFAARCAARGGTASRVTDQSRSDDMNENKKTNLSTIGQIARRHGASIHQTEYVIRSRGIEAAAWAGHARVFSEADVERIGVELRRIAAERGGDHV